MASKYTQLASFQETGDLQPDSNFLVSRGTWTSDDPSEGDIFTVLSSYRVPYSALSNNVRYSIEHATPEIGSDSESNSDSIMIDGEKWNFTANEAVKAATLGSLSDVNNQRQLLAAINYETCRMISSDAWWQIHRRCFDAAHAREMSGMVNRQMMVKGSPKLVANKFHMTAIIYDILNRHWTASEYFRTRGVLTCVNQIDKGKTVVKIKSGSQARVPTLYELCPFKYWSILPFDYKPEAPAYHLFDVGREEKLDYFMSCYIVRDREKEQQPISYYLIDTLDELSDVKNNIDMSIYDKNKFISLSSESLKDSAHTVQYDKESNPFYKYDKWHFRTIKEAGMPAASVDPSTRLSEIADPSAYGPTYLGNVHLYPVYEPYTFNFWQSDGQYGIYRSEPNPCGSQKMKFYFNQNYRHLFTFNPQQALWEFRRYLGKTNQGNLPGDLANFFEKFCKIRIRARRDPEPNAATKLYIKYTKPADPYMLSKMDGSYNEIVLDLTSVSTSFDTFVSRYITVAGNAPTQLQFKTEGNESADDSKNVRWTVWIDSMIIW